MGFFNIFKKKNKKEDKHMSTLDEVRKAYEDLSDDDKKTFHQSIADRVHESIAEQEKNSGTEDSQTAADREHEAFGAEHADERAEEEREGVSGDEKDKAQDERAEETHDEEADWRKSIDERFARIEEALSGLAKKDDDSGALEHAKDVYGLRGAVFSGDPEKSETITPKEAAEIARRFK